MLRRKNYRLCNQTRNGAGCTNLFANDSAEELEADLKDIIVEAMPFDADKGGQYQTGGSTSVMRQWMPLRKWALQQEKC